MTRKDSTVKKSGVQPRRPAQQQLERPVGHLEVIALVLQVLELVEDPPEDLAVELETELGAFMASVERPAISETTTRVPFPTEFGSTCS